MPLNYCLYQFIIDCIAIGILPYLAICHLQFAIFFDYLFIIGSIQSQLFHFNFSYYFTCSIIKFFGNNKI